MKLDFPPSIYSKQLALPSFYIWLLNRPNVKGTWKEENKIKRIHETRTKKKRNEGRGKETKLEHVLGISKRSKLSVCWNTSVSRPLIPIFSPFLFFPFFLFFSFFNFLFHLRFDALFRSKEGFRRLGDYQLKELPRRKKLCTVRCGPVHASWCILERERPQGGTRWSKSRVPPQSRDDLWLYRVQTLRSQSSPFIVFSREFSSFLAGAHRYITYRVSGSPYTIYL